MTTTTPKKRRLWVGALLACIAVAGFTGISQARIAQAPDDDGRPGDVSGPFDEADERESRVVVSCEGGTPSPQIREHDDG